MEKSLYRLHTLKFITGPVPSKKNAWKRTLDGRVYLKKDLQDQLDDLLKQLKSARHGIDDKLPIEDPVMVMIELFNQGTRKDIDNQASTILDLLQKAEIISNDRNIKSFSVTTQNDATKDVGFIVRISKMLWKK